MKTAPHPVIAGRYGARVRRASGDRAIHDRALERGGHAD
jgi:hypothetical protein